MDANSMEVQALITFITPFVIQLAKRSQSAGLAWIDQNKPKICMLTSAVAALGTSMGIEFAHAPHSFTVSWPDGATMARGVVAFMITAALQFIAQHALYEGFWRHVIPCGGVRSQESGVSK